MRKIAMIANRTDDIRRVMVYAADDGAYLFLYTRIEDGPCAFDEWYDSPVAAEQAACDRFGIQARNWTVIADPLPGAQHDWIRPTRLKRDKAGNTLWGQFEPIR